MEKRDLGSYRLGDFITDESFINYCLRNSTVDVLFWQKWISAHPEKNSIVKEAENTIRNFSLTLPEKEYQEELAKIRNAIRPERDSTGYRSVSKFMHLNKTFKGRNTSLRVIKWMIPAVSILLASWYFFIPAKSRPSSDLVENFNSGNIPLVFTLSDGSVITLAPHSGLRYPRKFETAVRNVYLNGEASFHVTADSTHPFKVYQDDLVATVLGTFFNIRKERKDSVMMIELMKGKLKVEIMATAFYPLQSILLRPNERVVYTQYNRRLLKEKWQIENGLPLRIDRMVFRQDNFDAIANKIKTTFGIIVINQSKKRLWRFTGEFTNSTASEILTSVCEIEGLTSEITGDTILIK